MSSLEDNFDEENVVTHEEQYKINQITHVSYVDKKIVQEPIPIVSSWNIWSALGLQHVNLTNAIRALNHSRSAIKNDPIRRLGISKIVTISNISGKNAWVILSPSRITSISSIGIDKIGQITLETSGECKAQQVSIPNETRSEYDLENSLSYISLFLHIDGKWKRVWIDRLFNTRKYNINILTKHVDAAIDYEFA